MPAMSPSREDIIHGAMIRAGLCAARGLPKSQACAPPGCPDHCEDILRMVCRADVQHLPAEDTEGGVE